jgi:exodeoxyribonuclease VII small subunit
MNESASDNMTFEQALLELERIVRELEDGQTGLEASLGHYEQGVALLKRCYGQLREAEQRILLLAGDDADGKSITRPFEHLATVDVIKADGKRRRKRTGDEDGSGALPLS